MTDIAERHVVSRRPQNLGDPVFRAATIFFALLVLCILGGVIVSLVSGAVPALAYFGWGFLFFVNWTPATEKFGALPAIYGTLVTS
ncbi:MAG: phosphate ABC transporter permease subunit PstC, partial [Alphaproteobacteria bacterium]|nr:phosphate ABC transporter permease subunit PstC [Alphaproteobacteria bacterium]